MKIKQHLPSIFTLINLFLGFLAIINTMAGDYVVACYIILAAGAFDSVDGCRCLLYYPGGRRIRFC